MTSWPKNGTRWSPESNQIEPDADLAMAEAPPTEPDADLAMAEAPPTEPDADLAMADTDLADTDLADTDLAEAAAPLAEAPDHEAATAIVPDDPDFTPQGDAATAEPGTADGSPGSPSMVSAAFTVPASVTDSQLAVNASSARGPWNEVQAMFVDDPRASIEQAAGLVDDRVEALIQSLRERQRSMQSAWWADDAGTEELRVALQHYRTFWNSLEDLPTQD